MRGKSWLKIFSSACLSSPRRECSTWGNVVIVNALLFSEYLHIWNTLASAHTPTAHTRTIYLTVYECPYFCFFDLLIMIKLVRASWLEMAQCVESWLFRFTASHSGAEKKTTKWRFEEDRTRLKTSTSNRRKKKKKKKCLKTAINLSFHHPNGYQMGFLPRSLEFPTWTKKERNENRW